MCSYVINIGNLFIVSILYYRGLVPLHNACSYGHYEVTELLIKVSPVVLVLSYMNDIKHEVHELGCFIFDTSKQPFARVPTDSEKWKKVQGQGKVREFWVGSGKFEIFEKVREKSGNFISTACHICKCIITVHLSRSMCLNSRMSKLLEKLWYRTLDWY